MKYNNSEQYDKYIGRVLDARYKLVKCIGEGSSAVVFKADDIRTGRPVAVKVLKPEHAKDVKSVKSFENECKVISMLSHDSIVRVVDVSIGAYSKYIVMEYIDGITMRKYMDGRGALSFEEIMDFCEQILLGLEHAHSKGIIHRDIKPQNIMLLPRGEVKITDFGIAQFNDEAQTFLADRAAGTAYYISPEQAAGGEIDVRSDIYSLGVLMYEMATGRVPFEGKDPITVIKKKMSDDPVRPSEINPKIPKGLEAIIMMAMEKIPEARFTDAGEMLKYLYKIKSRPNAIPRISETRKKQLVEKDDRKVKPSNSSTPVIWGVASALLFLALIAGYYIFTNLLFADKTFMVSKEVPNFVGTLYSENGMEYDEDYFEIKPDKIIFEYDENTPENTIIEQTPSAGTREKVIAGTKKCEIVLTVSLGAKTYTIPDYSLIDFRQVELDLRRMKFEVKVEYEYNPMVAEGLVINTVPGVGEKAIVSSEVIIKVSTGYEKENVKVPNFVDMSEVEAQKLMDEKGMNVGRVVYTRSNENVGTVLLQSVKADSIFTYSNITVDFIVSGGPSYDTNYIPNVVGMQKNIAIETLLRFGLVSNKITEDKSADPIENVITQSIKTDGAFPSGNDKIPADLTEIDLVLSGGPDYIKSQFVLTVPNITGMTLEEARKKLTDCKATLGTVQYIYSDTVPEGRIISQTDTPNSYVTAYPYEYPMNVIVSHGPEPTPETTIPPESSVSPETETGPRG